MYLIYFRIAKRKVLYKLQPVPSKLLTNILSKKYFDDINNTVVVNANNIYRHDKVVLLYTEGSNFCRPVYVLCIKDCKKDEIILSDTLYHNLSHNYNIQLLNSFKLFEYKEIYIKFAKHLDLSLINSPFDVSNAIIDGVLERFFRQPKIIKKDDILEINVRHYAPEIFYRNSKINHVENIYFKINKIICKEVEEKEGVCFCAIGYTEIKQSPNIQSYLPKRFYKQCYFSSHDKIGRLNQVSLCPYGLQVYLDNLEKSVKPFLTKSK